MLPEALAVQIGKMTVRYQGWEEWGPRDEETAKLLCSVAWGRRCYTCSLVLPLQRIAFDELRRLREDCCDVLRQVARREGDFKWRAQYLDKIETRVQKAAMRLYKQLLKEKKLPQGLRPRRVRRTHRSPQFTPFPNRTKSPLIGFCCGRYVF
jgi:hypothetical protein